MIILIVSDMFETYSEPSEHPKIFWNYIFENFRLKMNKNTFLGLLWLYWKAIAIFLSLETKSLDAYSQSIWQL